MSHLISNRAKSRTLSHFTADTLKNAPKGFEAHPNPIHLDYGTPNYGFFPINSIQVSVANFPFEEPASEPKSGQNGSSSNGVESKNSASSSKQVHIKKRDPNSKLIDIATGLQYSTVQGIPQLHKFTEDLVKRTHPPLFKDWATTLSHGAGEGLNKALDVFLDEGDVILMEEFTFTPVINCVKNVGAFVVPVKLNFSADMEQVDGIDLEYLSSLLDNWDSIKPEFKGKKPKALYTISSGQNPTGLTQSLEFRKKVYALAEKHDFAIIEDDPYGYLTLPPYQDYEISPDVPELSVEDYLANHLVPSYLTLDTTGRVLRVETMSKLFGPGLRLGFLVGHKSVIDSVSNYSTVVTRFTSGTSQMLVNNVIEQNFGGIDGWLEWILKLRAAYTRRRNILLSTLFKSDAYKAGYFEAIDPRAGMFVSVIINFPKTVDSQSKLELLRWKFRAYGVGVVAGMMMAVDKDFSSERGNFFRLTYAPADTHEEIIEGGTRFVRAVYDFFQNDFEY